MQKLLTILLTTCLTIATHAAANGIDGELLVKVGTTGNKAIPTSQTTNVTISATSKVTDGASAVAFSLNSSNALTSGNLLVVKNNGTNVYQFDPRGLLRIDGVVQAEILGEHSSGSYFDLWADGSDTYLYLGYNSGNDDAHLYPTASDGTVPYSFTTGVSHTSGNLAEFKNNTTNAATIAYNGSLTVHDIVGVTDASDAPAGSVGQYSSSAIALASAITLASGTSSNITSLTLTAGDWDVSGMALVTGTSLTGGVSTVTGGAEISTTSRHTPGTTGTEYYESAMITVSGANGSKTYPITRQRINVSTTTTVYLVVNVTFTTAGGANWKAWGSLTARRMR